MSALALALIVALCQAPPTVHLDTYPDGSWVLYDMDWQEIGTST